MHIRTTSCRHFIVLNSVGTYSCVQESNKCSHLCEEDESSLSGFTCGCPEGYILLDNTTCASECTYVHMYVHTYILTYILTYIHTYMHTYIHTYIIYVHCQYGSVVLYVCTLYVYQ